MVKSEIGGPYNTSFDRSLPIPSFRAPECYSIEIKGDLRSTEVDMNGTVRLGSTGRWSDHEEHEFLPDAPIEDCVTNAVSLSFHTRGLYGRRLAETH